MTDLTHDRFVGNTYSGRLVCRLTTEDPVVIGAEQTKATRDTPAEASPYELDGLPAIPATTLRGLISSTAEAASNSSLRVLEDELYSFRKTMDRHAPEKDKPLSSIGMVIVKDGEYWLRPLTLPTIRANAGEPVRLPAAYMNLFAAPNLKVYIGDADSIRDEDFSFETYTDQNKEFFYLELYRDADGDPRRWNEQGALPDDMLQHWKGDFLLAQKPIIAEEPQKLENIPENRLPLYTRGILRVLGCQGRDDIPNTKHHEIFIPYPEEAEEWQTFKILDDAVERFHMLADHRTSARKEDQPQLPYEPINTPRNLRPEGLEDRTFRLKHGDLVYFRPSETIRDAIAEISLSSIWRGRVESGADGTHQACTAHDFFRKLGGPPNRRLGNELLPFNKDRTVITPAEQMFGFVEKNEPDYKGIALALAGKVYPSPARVVGFRKADDTGWEESNRGLDAPYQTWRDANGHEHEWTPLKILASPKPPSPAMYFKAASGRGRYIVKRELNPNSHHPQGRKFYLHRRQNDHPRPWATNRPDEDCKQKVKVRPIKPRAVFYFHLDFDNLTKRELSLLLYSLRPCKEFRHKIGMGKPLGLGRVRIEPVGLFCVNRSKRYSEAGLFAPRYESSWTCTADQTAYPWAARAANPEEWQEATQDANIVEWRERYASEKMALDVQALNPSPNELHRDFRDNMDADIRYALELIGDPAALQAQVHTPLVVEQSPAAEDKTFQWFVANDLGIRNEFEPQRQFLEPLKPPQPARANLPRKLPVLRENPWSDND